jgi:hypothetical protein
MSTSNLPPSGTLANNSVLGRLFAEISWEGARVREYRDGGRGRENVLTAEVLGALSYLPRSTFLAAVCVLLTAQTRRISESLWRLSRRGSLSCPSH